MTLNKSGIKALKSFRKQYGYQKGTKFFWGYISKHPDIRDEWED